AVKKALEIVIKTAKAKGIISGLCGQRPSNDPEFAAFLVRSGIDSITVVPEVYESVIKVVTQAEKELEGTGFDSTISGWSIPEKEGNPERIICARVDANHIIREGGIHPILLLEYERGQLSDDDILRAELDNQLSSKPPREYIIDRVYTGIMTELANTPEDRPVIYVTDDLGKGTYESLIGGLDYEPLIDENPELGFNGLARVVDPQYQEFFRWQLQAIQKARQDSGRKNIGIRLSLVRTLDEVKIAFDMIRGQGFEPGEDGFMVGMDLADPSSVLLVNEFIELGINFLTENNERFLSYNLAIDPGTDLVRISDVEKEGALDIPRRVWTNAAEKNNIPLVQAADGFIKSADNRIYSGFSGGFDNVVNSLTDLADSQGALVIGANTILENAGTIASLRKIKESPADLLVAVWATDEALVEALKLMGVEDVVDILSSKGLQDVLSEFSENGIAEERIVLINSALDLENIKQEFKTEGLSQLLQDKDLKAINVKTPTAKEASLNTMPLVIARAIAGIFEDEQSVVKEYQELGQTYVESGLVSTETLEQLDDLTSQISEIPLVKVSEEIAQAQITYEETVDQI
ncbi:putative PEP-binding protein, partial [Candidatus Omnitrophota bacterium]